MVSLDTTVVNIALPAIGHDLGLGETQLGWVANAYLLAFGGSMLLGGRLVDRLGPRRAFRAGLAAFTVASGLAGLAPSAGLLIAARAVQGVAAAVVIPAQISLRAATFTEPDVHPDRPMAPAVRSPWCSRQGDSRCSAVSWRSRRGRRNRCCRCGCSGAAR
jgi:MFS family permease